jgi:D-alanine--poly(phosphoribitol) ligase subunit 1
MLGDARQFFDRLAERAERTPDRPAYANGKERVCYGELWENARKVAAHVERRCASKDPILVVGHKQPAMLAGFLGSAMTGRAYVPIDDKLPSERLENIRKVTRPSLELTAADISEVCRSPGGGAVCSAETDDAVYVLFTSGSTGEPKGVVVTWRCLLSFLNWMLAEQQFAESEEVFLGQAPFTFDLSVMDLYLSLASGGTHVSLPREILGAPRELFRLMAEVRPTNWISTPSFAAFCSADSTFRGELLPDLKRFLFCGETLPRRLAQVLLERFPEASVWNTYGPTECTVAVTSVRVTRELLDRVDEIPLGYAMPGAEVFPGDEYRRPVPAGFRGEILIVGPSVSPGYLARPELTNERFFDGESGRGYATGDLGILKDGMLFFSGRIDQQFKVNGFRIELGDVEQNLCGLREVGNAVVVPMKRNGVVEGIAAFVEVRARNGETDFQLAQQLRAAISKKLPAYMIPKKWVFRETLPTTANGKIDRKRLAGELAG